MLNSCKSDDLDSYLGGSVFENSSASSLTSSGKLSEMDSYVTNKLQDEENIAVAARVKDIKNEISNIESAISELENVRNKMRK